MTYPHLSRAPITEALLDIAVEREPGIAHDDLVGFTNAANGDFPLSLPIRKMQAAFAFGAEVTSMQLKSY